MDGGVRRGDEVAVEERLRKIKERLRATTPGAWMVREIDEDSFDDTPGVRTVDGLYVAQTSYDGLSRTCRPTMYADAEFIAHAKEDIEWLLERLEVFLNK